MAARHYFHCFKIGSAGQDAADVHAWASTPNANDVRDGTFALWFFPAESADEVSGSACLLSCDDGAGHTLQFRILQGVGNALIQVVLNGVVMVSRPTTYIADISFPLELQFVFDAVAGSITEYAAGVLLGTTVGDAWDMDVDDCAMRLGGLYGADGSEAAGLVSLPYAVQA